MRIGIQMTSSSSVFRLCKLHLFLHELGAWAWARVSIRVVVLPRLGWGDGGVTCMQLCDEAQTVSNW
jgi:hypothetical protein